MNKITIKNTIYDICNPHSGDIFKEDENVYMVVHDKNGKLALVDLSDGELHEISYVGCLSLVPVDRLRIEVVKE